MKNLCCSLALVMAVLVTTSAANARDIVLGLTPFVEPAVAEVHVKSVMQFLIETLEPGDSCYVFDAYRMQSLGTFLVPNKPAYRHPRAKLQANGQLVATLLQFSKTARKPQGGSEPSVAGAILLPQALRFLGMNYPVTQESDVILLGSPIYDDPKEQAFTMRPSYIPGDGHLTKARSVTPYGIKGQDSLLGKRRIHLLFPDGWKQDEHHEYFVHRFWTLFIEGQGGQLSSFTKDFSTAFQRVKSQAPTPKHAYKLDPTEKLEMILLRPPTVKQRTSIYEQPLSTVPVPLHILQQAPNVEVGITWECGGCDLDLYGKFFFTRSTLSYMNMQTPEGNYFKDWTSSPRATNGYETLAYHVPVDLNALLLAVNFYNGQSSGGVRGEMRISLNGQTYAKTFHISAPHGNGGAGREETLTARRAANAHWLIINPLEVIGSHTSHIAVSRQ